MTRSTTPEPTTSDRTNHGETAVAPVVKAFLDGSVSDRPVADVARVLSERLGTSLELVHVAERSADDGFRADASLDVDVRHVPGPVVPAIVRELDDPGAALGVIGARERRDRGRPLGSVALTVVTSQANPIVVVPPGARPLRSDRLRLLLPLDGDARTADALAELHAPLISRLGELVAVHVYGRGSAPMFVSSPEDREVLAKEFAARHLPTVDEPVHLRLGTPASRILAACEEHLVDAVVVCWKQRLESGRADVVRALLEDGTVPIVLVPVRGDHRPMATIRSETSRRAGEA